MFFISCDVLSRPIFWGKNYLIPYQLQFWHKTFYVSFQWVWTTDRDPVSSGKHVHRRDQHFSQFGLDYLGISGVWKEAFSGQVSCCLEYSGVWVSVHLLLGQPLAAANNSQVPECTFFSFQLSFFPFMFWTCLFSWQRWALLIGTSSQTQCSVAFARKRLSTV